jgi:hypothetical protein
MSLACFLPPGTLTISRGVANENFDILMPRLDWDLDTWNEQMVFGLPPSPIVQKLATESAQEADILKFVPPADNSSYTLDVRGPYLKCDEVNSTQISVLEYFQKRLISDPSTQTPKVTNSTFPLALEEFQTRPYTEINPQDPPPSVGFPNLHGVIMVAFDPILGEGWEQLSPISGSNIEPFNTWQVDLPTNFENLTGYSIPCPFRPPNATSTSIPPTCRMSPLQLWILTSQASMICTLGNGSRTAHFDFEEGKQTISYEPVQDFNPVFILSPQTLALQRENWTALDTSSPNHQTHSYMSVYLSLVNMLSGNVTMWMPWATNVAPFLTDKSYILQTGLDACDDITGNIWSQNYTTGPLFHKPSYMCRNRTLARAIEDLSANITISMMTSSELT